MRANMTSKFSVTPIIENIFLIVVLHLLPCYNNINGLRFFGNTSLVLPVTPVTEVII